jgi:hypothetical protein
MGVLFSSPPSLLYLDLQTLIYITSTPVMICCTEDPLLVSPFSDSRLQSDISVAIVQVNVTGFDCDDGEHGEIPFRAL